MFRALSKNMHEEFKFYKKRIALLDRHCLKVGYISTLPADENSYLDFLERRGPSASKALDALIQIDTDVITPDYLKKPLIENINNFLDAHGYMWVTVNSEVFLQDPMTQIIIQQINSLSLEELNQQDERGNTALHHAMCSHNVHIVKALHLRGVNLDVKNNLGQTALAVGVLRLATIQYSYADFADTTRYLVEETNASRDSLNVTVLDINLEKHLSKLQSTNWKTSQQEKQHQQESSQDKKQEETDKEIEEEFIQENLHYDSDIKITEEVSIARLVARSIILQRDAEDQDKDRFYKVCITALNKLITELPMVERILYLYARKIKQDVNTQTSPHILALQGNYINSLFPNGALASGRYFGNCVLAFALQGSTEDFISDCEKFIDKEGETPKALCFMIHEILHLLIDKYYLNDVKMYAKGHPDEDWKLENNCRKLLEQDFKTAKNYVTNSIYPEKVRPIYEQTVGMFTGNELSVTPWVTHGFYRHELITTEMPTLFITAYTRCRNIKLMEKMLPNTMRLLIETLNNMYIDCKKFSESNIVQSNTHCLAMPEEHRFNMKAKTALNNYNNNEQTSVGKAQMSFFKSEPAIPTQSFTQANNANDNNNSSKNNRVL